MYEHKYDYWAQMHCLGEQDENEVDNIAYSVMTPNHYFNGYYRRQSWVIANPNSSYIVTVPERSELSWILPLPDPNPSLHLLIIGE